MCSLMATHIHVPLVHIAALSLLASVCRSVDAASAVVTPPVLPQVCRAVDYHARNAHVAVAGVGFFTAVLRAYCPTVSTAAAPCGKVGSGSLGHFGVLGSGCADGDDVCLLHPATRALLVFRVVGLFETAVVSAVGGQPRSTADVWLHVALAALEALCGWSVVPSELIGGARAAIAAVSSSPHVHPVVKCAVQVYVPDALVDERLCHGYGDAQQGAMSGGESASV